MADIAVNKQVLSEGAGEDYERPPVHDQVTIVMSCTTANDDEKDVALRYAKGDLSTSAASLDPLKRVERAGEIKTIGNDFFKQGNMEAALTCYSDCLTLLAEDFRFAPEIKAQSRALKIPICLNIAACQLRQRKFRDVVGICTELLQQDATLVKAYFRRAKAHQALGDFDDALQDYEAALHNSDESSEGLRASFVSAIERVKQAKADQDKQDKKVYERMFKETK
ncbi:hypothetical protein PTSG_11325 [Salpingoeca rosetta]|uniref:Uncharacterized protein n=1 Tax=Salpingoeca rosetta (strain ATCC 50818 / BSB-021) TaxID=946362 RepID=F2UT29_SALR5|nr:uncharacterized protein PTSG_11325 [Salpingoeca rosetta]EGD81288.1 hypothetical protein PTSG_11325 [Salpingoeca rosetta]|eukprot:XP_004987684.1 hypothetical protein PTSG_11325 [Salpingoeca rosetta]